MKSSFLFLILGALITTQVFGQVTKKTATLPAAKVPTQTSAVVEKTQAVEKSSFDKFYERLGASLNLFYTSPNFKKWDHRYGAISPEYGKVADGAPCKNCDTYPQNIWSQFNISYNYGGKMKFNIIPRATMFLTAPPAQDKGDRAFITIEDALVGFSGTVYTSEDKKFSWWMRPAIRIPTSHFSRGYDNGDFGNISYQPDWLQSFTYQATEKFAIALAWINRVWIFEDRYNQSRHRMIFNPSLTYSVSDKTQVILDYTSFLENNKSYESVNGKGLHYTDVWQSSSIGFNHNINEKHSINPYLAVFVNDVPLTMASTYLAISYSYTLK